VEEFITTLQKDVGKKFIITAQTYDGAAAMRFQCKGHVLSRLSAWGFYIYCRSHLLNLSIKDAIEGSFYDTFDTIKSALVFLGDSTHILRMICMSVPSIGIIDYSPSFLRFLVVGIISREFPDSMSVV
jgi:hypothetical protein